MSSPVGLDWSSGGARPYQPQWFDSRDGQMQDINTGPSGGRPVVLAHCMSRSDPLSEALRLLRVDTTMVFRVLAGAPWGVGIEAGFGPAFHILTGGGCYLETDGQPGQLHLASGDLVILPAGRRHWIRDRPATPAPALRQLLTSAPPDGLGLVRLGGTGPPTWMVSGGFTLQAGRAHLLSRFLPPVIHIRGTAGEPAPWVATMLSLLTAENAAPAPGSAAIVDRLADLLLTQALRAALADDAPASLPALQDRQVARAIELIHRDPQRPWTVGGLAGEVALSRSAFAARFSQCLGESPGSYLTRIRLTGAASALRSTSLALPQIALQAGYASQFSFSKAFKRAFGLPPSTYRSQPSANPRPTGPDADPRIAR